MNAPGTLTVAEALATGAALGVYYDCFRIFRRIFRAGYATIVAQDVFFWLTGAVMVFFVNIWFSGGTVRIYFIAAVLIGWGIYAATIGALLMFVVDKMIVVAQAVTGFFCEKCMRPMVRMMKNRIKFEKVKEFLIFAKKLKKTA